ncbi:zinc transporter 10 isoform X3 [Felis catus]|uniref:zinc transporter 10 isoform X3 n=1 Tax=Felis catus TaxID=9685 RepID=UPI001D19C9E4|nr:zinc transporter 10 isoform X3 [Felis catus]
MGRYSGKTCRLLFMLVLTVAFFVAELVSGYLGNSIALLSDSFNMLSDLISLCVGLGAGYVARRPRGGLGATYGYARAEVLGALSNAVFLTALCFTISVEAVLRLARPERIDDPELVLIVGALGLAVNVLGLLIFQDCAAWLACWGPRRRRRPPPPTEGRTPRAIGAPRGAPGPGQSPRGAASADRKEERGATVFSNVAGDSLNTQNEPEETMKKEKKSEALNIRGVLLHVMGDALGSVVVVVTAIIFYVRPLKGEDPCNWQCYIDPSLTVIMVAIILSSAFPLIKETAAILLQMVPKGVNTEELNENNWWPLLLTVMLQCLSRDGKQGYQMLFILKYQMKPSFHSHALKKKITTLLSLLKESFLLSLFLEAERIQEIRPVKYF